jgi:hypothetical protein
MGKIAITLAHSTSLHKAIPNHQLDKNIPLISLVTLEIFIRIEAPASPGISPYVFLSPGMTIFHSLKR